MFSARNKTHLSRERKVYPSADFVDPYTEYRWQMIFVKHLLTHSEYDRKEWTK